MLLPWPGSTRRGSRMTSDDGKPPQPPAAPKPGAFRVDPDSIARVQARLDALAARYPEMVQPDYERLSALWQQLRAGGGTPEEDEAFRRIIHDLKGQGGS